MKKKLLIFLGTLFLLFAAFIISAPFLIKSQKVQDQILARINSWYVVDASVQNIHFTWFPFPHVNLDQVEVLHQDFSVSSPKTVLYPSWKILLGLSSLGRVNITDPVIQIHQLSPTDKDESFSSARLPPVKLVIENGTLILPEHQNRLFGSKKTALNNIAASFSFRGRGGNFSWKSDADFAKKIIVNGKFDPKGRGTLKGEIQDLHTQKILDEKKETLLHPLHDISTISFTVKRSLQDLVISFMGDIPDFSFSRQDTTENFRIGDGEIALHFSPNDKFTLEVKTLQVLEPQLTVKGIVSRYFPKKNQSPNIKIDLQSEHADLTAVRHKVLSLLADSSVAQKVCDIVRSAQAKKVTYFFDAPVEDFENISSMTIGVDLDTSEIHLADIPLDLNKAQGPILIKDGDLTGKNITTWVGDAEGTNGNFLVGLADDKYGLKVDVDIDANLEELPAVLRDILDDQDVVDELGKVQGRGRAHGHLKIGDDLRDFNVLVDVDKFDNAELRYERLSWPLRPISGNLQVTGNSVSWKDIQAQMGSHTIQQSSGNGSWQSPDTPFSIDSLHAFVDTNTLFSELTEYPVLREAFKGVIASVQGGAEVTGTLQGPFFQPEEYTYNFETRLKDITFKTPKIPEQINVEEAFGTISHQDINISSSEGTLFGKKIDLKGTLSHHEWQVVSGNLHINSVIGSKHFNWLQEYRLFPDIIIPRPLYHVQGAEIIWDDKVFNLQGVISPEESSSTVDLKIQNKAESFSGLFKVKNKKDFASATLYSNSKTKKFTASFRGALSKDTLHTLVDDSLSSFDSIRGDFKVSKTRDPKKKLIKVGYDGNLVANDLQWIWGKEKRICKIPTLNLGTEKNVLKIKKLEAVYNNESFGVSGLFTSKPGQGHFELDINSDSTINTTNIEKFQEDLDHFLYSVLEIPRKSEDDTPYEISGRFMFDLKNLVLPFGTEGENKDGKHTYKLPVTPLKGTYEFSKSDSELNLQDSVVCGVELNGQLAWQGPKESTKELSLMSPVATPLEFEKFLSCFNFDGIIEGPLEISGRIYSDSKLCKRGGLFLTSKKGTIKRFVALAKTLSLINITGLSGAIWTEGFYYNSLEVSGNICDNVFTIEKAFIDGDGVDVVATGDINLSTMEYDVTFFVVPFATINGLVTKVPLVGRVLGGSEGRIVSVPVKITGPLHDPKVTVLSPSAIGEATGKWILDTITLPFGWLIPEKKDLPLDQPPGETLPPAGAINSSSSSGIQSN